MVPFSCLFCISRFFSRKIFTYKVVLDTLLSIIYLRFGFPRETKSHNYVPISYVDRNRDLIFQRPMDSKNHNCTIFEKNMDPNEMIDMTCFESRIEAPLISSQDFAHMMTDPTEMVQNQCNPFKLECLYDFFCKTDHQLMEGLSKDTICVSW